MNVYFCFAKKAKQDMESFLKRMFSRAHWKATEVEPTVGHSENIELRSRIVDRNRSFGL